MTASPKSPPTNLDQLNNLLAAGPQIQTNVEGRYPDPEGVRRAPSLYPGDLGAPPARAELPRDLSVLSAKLVFFYPVLLRLIGGLEIDPVELHYAEKNLPAGSRPRCYYLHHPILVGPPKPWDRTLLACPREFWDDLSLSLSVSGLDRIGRRYWRTLCQQLPVPARTDLAPPELYCCPQTIPVYFYGVDASDYLWYFVPPTFGHTGPVFVSRAQPQPETVQEGRVLLDGDLKNG